MGTHPERRRFTRVTYNAQLNFTILSTQDAQLQKISASGTIINASDAGIGLMTSYLLQPGHVLEWDDEHRKGFLHIALVKWAQQQEGLCRAGLMFV